MKSITQDLVDGLAARHGINPGPLEASSFKRIGLFLDKDVSSAAYCMAVVSFPEGAAGPIKAFCGLYEKRKLADDGEAEYPDLERAMAEISIRFQKLESAFFGQVAIN